ncbi:MAG: HpaII family restriction endonuclease, partial [Muribaculaceae bacterium]|nr:HpaII family restriction endonuclease [Muribaculaceae bacterium]
MIEYFRRILTDSRNITKVGDIFYPFYVVLYDKQYIYHEDLQSIGVIISSLDGEVFLCVPANIFLEEVAALIKISSNSDDIVSTTSAVIENLFCNSVRDTSKFKNFVKIFWLDRSDNHIGSTATLLNASGDNTNFIYKVEFPEGVNVDCDKFNAETYDGLPSKISARLAKIEELGGSVSFDSIQSDCLTQNLRTIDDALPVILANALLLKYTKSISSWAQIIEELNAQNPLGYRIADNSPVYEVKIARFLQDAAMGMTPETPWSGFYDADGGQIVVKKDGDIVCYHIYELNRFRQYLLNATRIEQPST